MKPARTFAFALALCALAATGVPARAAAPAPARAAAPHAAAPATHAAHAAAPAAAAPLPADPAPPPLRLPMGATKTLPNGLRVVVFPQTRSPIVHVQLLVPAGSRAEADTLPGLAALTAELLRHGTTSRAAEQFTAELAQDGATFTSWSGRDVALVAMGTSSTAFESALELMSDAVLNPAFAGDDFEAQRDAWAQRYLGQGQSPAALADERIAAAAFGPHPYGHAPLSRPAQVTTLSRTAVQSFYRDRWRPDRAVLVIAGQIEPDRAFAAATEWFGRWAGHTAPDAPLPAPKPAGGVQIVDVPGASRVELRVALPGPGLADPDYAAWSLAEAGLEASERVPSGVRPALVTARDASLLVLSAVVSKEQAADALRLMTQALHAYAGDLPSGAELAATRHRAAGRYALTLETLGSFASQWQADDFAGLPADAAAAFTTRLATADPASVRARLAAAPVLLALGPAEALRGPLAALGKVEVSPLELAAPSDSTITLPPPTAAEAQRGRELVAAAVKAHGGAPKLAGVHTLVHEGDLSLQVGAQHVDGLFSIVREDPERISIASKMFKLEVRQVYDRGKAWGVARSDSVEKLDVDSASVHSLRSTLYADLVHELRTASAAAAAPAARGSETIDGHACDLVDFTSPVAGHQRFALDAATHTVVAIDETFGPDGTWHTRRKLADLRPVEGILLPFSEERWVEGQRIEVRMTRLLQVNTAVDTTLFDRSRAIEAHPLPR